MDRLATIQTKVRPIRKLFLLEPDDWQSFYSVLPTLTTEIAGVCSLFALHNDSLKSDNAFSFVEQHDPDVIVNFSTLSDTDVQNHFKTPTVSGKTTERLASISTSIQWWDQIPQPHLCSKPKGKVHVFAGTITSTLEQLLGLHFGVLPNDAMDVLEHSVFKKKKIVAISTLEQFFALFWGQPDRNFLLLWTLFDRASGGGSSIRTINYNPDHLFSSNYPDKKPTIVFGSTDDLSSVVYWWNMRATYPYNKTLWFPIEMAEQQIDNLAGFSHCCDFTPDKAGLRLLRQSYPDIVDLDETRYYFDNHLERWTQYEFVQNVSVHGDKLLITHPHNRLFSAMGFNMSFVLQVNGLWETRMPKSADMGELFIKKYDSTIRFGTFSRVSQNGLSFYAESFEPLGNQNLVYELSVPTAQDIIQGIFADHGLRLEQTRETALAQQVIRLIGGSEQIRKLRDKTIHDLLVKLTPPRSEKIVKHLSREIMRQLAPDSPDYLRLIEETINQTVPRAVGSLETINSEIIADLPALENMVGINAANRQGFHQNIEWLYQSGILLRGKSFRCPNCRLRLWYSLHTVTQRLECYGCESIVTIPISDQGRMLGDYYRLNELMSNAVDQGILPLLSLLDFVEQQKFYSTRYEYNVDVLSSDGKMAEVDLVFTLGRRLGLGEAKADRGFDLSQVDRLLDVAHAVQADILLFGTLKRKTDPEPNALRDYLGAKNLSIPAFIATGDTLLTNSNPSIARFFEASLHENNFPKGPFIL